MLWLDLVGLPQYRDLFAEHRMDGQVGIFNLNLHRFPIAVVVGTVSTGFAGAGHPFSVEPCLVGQRHSILAHRRIPSSPAGTALPCGFIGTIADSG